MSTTTFKGQLTFPNDCEEENKWVAATLARITPLISIPKNQNRRNLRDCVKAILANSIASYRKDGLSKWVWYPNDKNLDALHNAENKYSKEILRRVVEAMKEADILEELKNSALNTFESKQVVYKIHERELEQYNLSSYAEPFEYWNKPVVMRTKKRRYIKGGEQRTWKIPVPLPKGEETKRIIEEVLAYRDMLSYHSIHQNCDYRFSEMLEEISGRWYAGSVRRIFTHPEGIPQNEDVGLVFNGRWFACWQNWEKEYRHMILLDGHPTCMWDYHACSLQIIYGLEGLPFARNRNSYQVEGFSRKDIGQRNAERFRGLLKTIVLIMLNCRSRGGAKRAINNLFTPTAYDMPYQIEEKDRLAKWWNRLLLSADQIIEKVLEKHERISSSFFTGIGLKVMNYESEITGYIYKKFIDNDKPILGFHDGYLVKQSDCGFLYRCMEEGFREVLPSTRKNHRVIIKREF